MQVQCDQCGKVFERTPSTVSEHNFCSRACSSTYRIGKGNPVITQCAQCGKTIEKQPSQVMEHTFCSYACNVAYKAANSIVVAVPCEYCGKTFSRFPSQVRERNFCSKACSYASQTTRVSVSCACCGKATEKSRCRIGERNFCSKTCQHAYRVGKNTLVTVPCDYCGKMLERLPARLEANKHQFCDQTCFGAFQFDRVQVECSICHNSMEVHPSKVKANKHFACSPECNAKLSRDRRIAYFGSADHRIATCEHCGKQFERKPSQLTKYPASFCSRTCKASHQTGEESSNWKGGRIDPDYYGFEWRRIAATVRERDGFTCQCCGKRQGDKGFAVHHIIPLREFLPDRTHEAHALANLVLLCPTCHRKVEIGKIALPACS